LEYPVVQIFLEVTQGRLGLGRRDLLPKYSQAQGIDDLKLAKDAYETLSGKSSHGACCSGGVAIEAVQGKQETGIRINPQ
jgi:hypothetical protein